MTYDIEHIVTTNEYLAKGTIGLAVLEFFRIGQLDGY